MFRVTKQFPNGPELDPRAFMDREVAEQYIQGKLTEDAGFRLKTVYKLYDDLDHLLKTFSTEAVDAPPPSDSGSKPGSGQRFSPTPFNTSPRPGGIPPSSFRKDDDEDKDK